MFKIVLLGVLFGGSYDLGIGPFITYDACKAVASHVIADFGKPACVGTPVQ